MNFKKKLDRLDGVFAFDTGCVTSGIKDDEFKRSLMSDKEMLTKLLTGLAKQYLTSNQRYTIEDIKKLLDWAEEELDLYL